jgi:isoleucyl-tRNA synthetase
MQLEFTDRIVVGIATESDELQAAVTDFGSYIRGETLAVDLQLGPLEGVEPIDATVAGFPVELYVRVVSTGERTAAG